jgi:leader peptidase (prepilin peptidase) / N-methyltransferase
MTGLFVLVGALFGLTLGSFLNVVVFRTPRHLSVVRPGSFCPSCKAELTAIDNVPVLAWLWLRGKCRHCGEPISVRYPLVEAGTAVVFVVLALTIRPLWGVPGWWALAATLGVATLIEAEGKVCPPAVALVGGGIGIAALAIGGAVAGQWEPVPRSAIGLAAGILVAGAIVARPRLRAEFGSATLGTVPAWGTALGWLGATPAVIGCVLALVGLLATTPVRFGPESSGLRVRWGNLPATTYLTVGLVAAVLAASLSTGR